MVDRLMADRDRHEFVEAEGAIHLVSGEFTLCGDAFDLGSHEAGYEWKKTARRVVTCERCANIVRLCRGVRMEGQSNV